MAKSDRKLWRSSHGCGWRGLLLLGVLLGMVDLSLQAQTARHALVLDLKGPIGPATSDHVHRGLAEAQAQAAVLAILRIDTPGGLDTAMREIVQDIVNSPIPVVGYVAPSGARAASAGTYILYASHVAAMAPGTNLGAATPVQIGGPKAPFPLPGRDDPKQPTSPSQPGDSGEATPSQPPAPTPTLADKAVSDAVAYIRSLAQMRGRNADWAERAVREAASLPATEALAAGVIDLMAEDLDDLLGQIEGRPVTVLGKLEHLATDGLDINVVEPDWRTRFLGVITNPNIAYILMLVGIYGLILEFYSPGLFVPGITGAISLLLALYAFQLLPVNYAGLALLLLGVALMVSEAFAPSFGALGLGGAVAFVIGSVMLLETDVPGYGVSWVLIASLALVSAGLFLLVITMLVRSRRRAVVSGPEEMIGSLGHVVDWSGNDGHVRVHGEIWHARAAQPFKPGGAVRVARIQDLTLTVEADTKEEESKS